VAGVVAATGALVVAGEVVVAGDAVVVGAEVVAGDAVVVGAAVVDGAAVVVETGERVTAIEYVVVEAPDVADTANEIFSVAPSDTERTSVSLDMAMVPNTLVRLIAAPDALANAVKVTDDEMLGIVNE
jgi:hypothetical protein